MRKTLGICLLVLLLTGSAVAGEMPNLSPAPPSQPANAAQEPTDGTTLTGEMHTPPVTSESLIQTALEILAALPSLL